VIDAFVWPLAHSLARAWSWSQTGATVRSAACKRASEIRRRCSSSSSRPRRPSWLSQSLVRSPEQGWPSWHEAPLRRRRVDRLPTLSRHPRGPCSPRGAGRATLATRCAPEHEGGSGS